MNLQSERLLLIHYHEIGLKGKNRGRFENRLVHNIKQTLKDLPCGPIQRISGRILLELTPETPIEILRERLSGVFGIANFSEAVLAPHTIEGLRDTAWAVAQKSTFASFKIATKRSDKTFPLNSEEINR
ncbi:MAG: THUMP domain-containing protein, partial [bacterium]|nr:THUMP domain-containing protein [bacterium]